MLLYLPLHAKVKMCSNTRLVFIWSCSKRMNISNKKLSLVGSLSSWSDGLNCVEFLRRMHKIFCLQLFFIISVILVYVARILLPFVFPTGQNKTSLCHWLIKMIWERLLLNMWACSSSHTSIYSIHHWLESPTCAWLHFEILLAHMPTGAVNLFFSSSYVFLRLSRTQIKVIQFSTEPSNMTYPANLDLALQPPPGVVPNLVNPENQNRPLLIVASFELGIVIVFILNRLYFKSFSLRKYSWDDCQSNLTLCSNLWLTQTKVTVLFAVVSYFAIEKVILNWSVCQIGSIGYYVACVWGKLCQSSWSK